MFLVQVLQNPKTQEIEFKKLINEYQQPLYWHIRKIILNHNDTDDILQHIYKSI